MQYPHVLPLVLFASLLSAQPGRHDNPVLPGDFPDPSMIRVGGEYWATATSSQWAPIFPLLRSTDLVHWRQVGAVFASRPAWSEQNYWAPEIARHDNRYFVYYTAKKKAGPLCVAVATADKPAGPYTDHGPLVCQEVGSIDAMPVTDENGRRYLVWKEDGNSRRQPTPLWAQPLSDDGTRLVGERKEILRNDAKWEGQLIEGPFILRRDGWFYLFYSGAGCCGLKCDYALGVARSRSLLGPWEKNPANPILAGNDHWRCPGHGSIVDDAQGRTWLLYHAYHPKDFVYVGRQGLLDEVAWGGNGWPSINQGKGPSDLGSAGTRNARTADEFSSKTLGADWTWPRSLQPRAALSDGYLVLTPEPGREGKLDGAVIAQLATAGDFVATTAIDTGRLAPGTQAGLAAFGNEENAMGLAVGDGKLTLWVRERGKESVAETAAAPKSGQLHLRMTATGGNRFRFAYSADSRQWSDLGGPLPGTHLPPWDLAPRIALTASGAARFDFLRVVEMP